jgi:hypothetical protein
MLKGNILRNNLAKNIKFLKENWKDYVSCKYPNSSGSYKEKSNARFELQRYPHAEVTVAQDSIYGNPPTIDPSTMKRLVEEAEKYEGWLEFNLSNTEDYDGYPEERIEILVKACERESDQDYSNRIYDMKMQVEIWQKGVNKEKVISELKKYPELAKFKSYLEDNLK